MLARIQTIFSTSAPTSVRRRIAVRRKARCASSMPRWKAGTRDRPDECRPRAAELIYPARGSAASAYLPLRAHRGAPRRAADLRIGGERCVNPAAIRYMNRVSDHLFVLARWENEKGSATYCGSRAGTASGGASARNAFARTRHAARRQPSAWVRPAQRAKTSLAGEGRRGRCRRSVRSGATFRAKP